MAEKCVSLEGLPVFLSFWCSIFKKQIQRCFFLFFTAKGVLWLPQELWLHQVAEVLMPGKAEWVEPDGRAGGTVASTPLKRVPSTVTKSGFSVCFAVLAVEHDHSSAVCY